MKPPQPSVKFYIETSYLIWTTNQMTGFYVTLDWDGLI